MISKELAKKIRYLEIYTRKAVNDSLAGEYHSVFKGQGIEFDEVREYQVGDEVRSIDWNVTARMGHPYVKRFVEERELTVIFLVDLSASIAFGSVQKLKNEVAAELCSLLAFSAIKNNDKAGLIIFTDKIEMFIPPAKGTTHVNRLIRELLNFKPQKSSTDIPLGLEYLAKVITKRSVVFLVSDFPDLNFERQLNIVGRKHDLIAVSLIDPREVKLPKVGLIELEDSETGEVVTVDTSSLKVRKEYEKIGETHRMQLSKLFRSISIDQVDISTDQDFVSEIIKFFKTRERRRMM
jgi:uncharacterized protein (DUF58 family)